MTDEEKIEAVTAKLLPPWGSWAQERAVREGWGLMDCEGSANGPWQIQKLDEAPQGCVQLESDDEAWDIVANGVEAHHAAAREFLRDKNPSELKLLQRRKS